MYLAELDEDDPVGEGGGQEGGDQGFVHPGFGFNIIQHLTTLYHT